MEKQSANRMQALFRAIAENPNRSAARAQFWEDQLGLPSEERAQLPDFFNDPGNVDVLFCIAYAMIDRIKSNKRLNQKALQLWGAWLTTRWEDRDAT